MSNRNLSSQSDTVQLGSIMCPISQSSKIPLCDACPGRTRHYRVRADEGTAEVPRVREECERRGYWISHDGRLRERDAAELMGLAQKTLRNRRALKDPNLPAFVKRRGRPLYSIASLAAWLLEIDER
jgi:hypothetical protein